MTSCVVVIWYGDVVARNGTNKSPGGVNLPVGATRDNCGGRNTEPLLGSIVFGIYRGFRSAKGARFTHGSVPITASAVLPSRCIHQKNILQEYPINASMIYYHHNVMLNQQSRSFW